MLIKTTSGVELGGAVSASSTKDSVTCVKINSSYRIKFRFRCALNPGVYFINSGVVGDVENDEKYLHRLLDAAMFRVQSEPDNLVTGIVDFGCFPEIQFIHE